MPLSQISAAFSRNSISGALGRTFTTQAFTMYHGTSLANLEGMKLACGTIKPSVYPGMDGRGLYCGPFSLALEYAEQRADNLNLLLNNPYGVREDQLRPVMLKLTPLPQHSNFRVFVPSRNHPLPDWNAEHPEIDAVFHYCQKRRLQRVCVTAQGLEKLHIEELSFPEIKVLKETELLQPGH